MEMGDDIFPYANYWQLVNKDCEFIKSIPYIINGGML